MANEFTLTIGNGSEFTVNGTDDEIKKALTVLGEFLLSDKGILAANIRAIVEIADYFWQGDKGTAEDLALAKKFFAAAEEFGDPEASDRLSCLQDNPLIAEAMWLRAAERNAPSPVYDLQETYQEQATYWRKKIAGENVDDDKIKSSERLKFFSEYDKAFAGDPNAMKTCLEFCEEEAAYWSKREP